MKNSQFFMAAGAVVLSVAGFLATKANKMRAAVTTAYGNIAGAAVTFRGLPAAHFTNIKGTTGKTAFVKTVGNGKLTTLFTTSGLLSRVYYK